MWSKKKKDKTYANFTPTFKYRDILENIPYFAPEESNGGQLNLYIGN